MVSPDLPEIRTAIDAVDAQLVDLIARRQQWVEAAGRAKAGHGPNLVRAPARVEEVVARARARAAKAGASADVVEATYRAMIGAFIDLELDVADPPSEHSRESVMPEAARPGP